MNKEIINDQKETIHRLQQECTEKTNAIIALGERLKAKEQECEELKEKCEELKEDRYNLNMEMYTLARYRKALEEIEGIIKQTKQRVFCQHCAWYNTDGCDPSDKICGDFIKILDIINKAKGEGND